MIGANDPNKDIVNRPARFCIYFCIFLIRFHDQNTFQATPWAPKACVENCDLPHKKANRTGDHHTPPRTSQHLLATQKTRWHFSVTKCRVTMQVTSAPREEFGTEFMYVRSKHKTVQKRHSSSRPFLARGIEAWKNFRLFARMSSTMAVNWISTKLVGAKTCDA